MSSTPGNCILRSYGPACAILGASVAAVLVAAAQPRDPGLVAAIFPPWWSAQDVLAAGAVAGAVVGAGGVSFVVIVKGGPDLPARLRALGGIAVSPSIAALCTVRSVPDV